MKWAELAKSLAYTYRKDCIKMNDQYTIWTVLTVAFRWEHLWKSVAWFGTYGWAEVKLLASKMLTFLHILLSEFYEILWIFCEFLWLIWIDSQILGPGCYCRENCALNYNQVSQQKMVIFNKNCLILILFSKKRLSVYSS